MKATFTDSYATPYHLELRNVDAPVPGEGEVLLRVRSTAINPADLLRLTGTPYIARLGNGLRSPKRTIPGADISGVIESVGDGVKQLKVGDEVFGWTEGGGLAELVAVPESQLVQKPRRVSFEEAAATGTAAFTALQALRDTGRLKAGEQVLINGASGGVGTFAIQIAHARRATVTAVCSTRNVGQARELGAETVIDYTKDDFTETNEGYDLILDIPGNRRLRDIRRIIADQGRYVLVGGSKGQWLGPIPQLLRGLLLSLVTQQQFTALNARHNRDDLLELSGLLDRGEVTPVVERTFALANARAALRHLDMGYATGKIVVVP